jgi:hypothetical protein
MGAVFAEPFLTRWLIDVEILARLIAAGRSGLLPGAAEVVYELPLRQWHDVAGSKVKPLDFPKALLELRTIARHYLRRAERAPVMARIAPPRLAAAASPRLTQRRAA